MAILTRRRKAALLRKRRSELLKRANMVVIREELFLQSGLKSEDVAKALGTNRTYFWQALHSQGLGFQEYLSRFRLCHFIENAAAFEGMQGLEIAERCGFNDKKVLNKYLKKALGISFKEYMEWIAARGPST